MRRETLMMHETHGVEELANFINEIINSNNKKLVKVNAYPTGAAHIDYWKIEEVKDDKILVW